ncbi:MAG: DUF547 domain-containing protein [Saprospiraceae bacterium]|nr:DUF547 domain-containing protein [Saprospiraceae bacterium]
MKENNNSDSLQYHSILETAGQLLLNVKSNVSTEKEIHLLQNLHINDFKNVLDNDATKKCFWINIYNSFYQLLAMDSTIDRNKIFKLKKVHIAGNHFSLDDIEHGILRRYRWKWSLGYLPNPFAPREIRDLAVDHLDYRIHFALNCGAASCPPISFYTLLKLENQLDTAMASFIEGETSIEGESKVVRTSRLLQWYLGDFGGKKGILKLIEIVFNQNLSAYDIIYNPYNWDVKLANYSQI